MKQANKIFKEYSNTVVAVVTFDENNQPLKKGSGFVVRADGAIVTNYHLISDASDIKIKAGDEFIDIEGLIYEDKKNDLVILKLKCEKLPAVKIGDSRKVTIGEKVYVIGSPKGMDNTVSDGLLNGVREITSDRKVLQITAPVSPVSSGSPVFNKNGEVIGIATIPFTKVQNLNFAMPVDLIKDKIENKKVEALKKSETEDYKRSAEYLVYLGQVCSESCMYKQAIESFRQAIRINPRDTEAHCGLGIAYHKSSLQQEAMESFKRRIRIDPGDAEAHYGLGKIYVFLNDLDSALEEYRILKELDNEMAKDLYSSIHP